MRQSHPLSEELRRLASDRTRQIEHIGPARLPERGNRLDRSLAPGSVVTDNRARTYLANERTFLAWLRTGITMIALGLAALEFLARHTGDDMSRLLAFSLICAGTMLVVVEWFRYRRRDQQIEHGDLHGSPAAVSLAAGAVAIIGLLAAWFVGGAAG